MSQKESRQKNNSYDPAFLAGLRAYVERDIHPWHTPGHKQGRGAHPGLRRLMGKALAYDLSDVLGGEGTAGDWDKAVAEAESAAARVCGAAYTRFLVNGASSGIHAMFLAFLGEEDAVIIPRHSHLSYVGGLVLSGARPVYIPVEVDEELKLPIPPGPAQYAAALAQAGGGAVRAALVTSPNYYGLCPDLVGIARVLHRHDVVMMVDEAHGAHFSCHPELPLPALAAGADVVVQSPHKTLGVLTQAAMIHLGAGVEPSLLKRALFFLGTTSPSSLLLASLTAAAAQLAAPGNMALWRRLLAEARRLRARINSLPDWRCLTRDDLPKSVAAMDEVRLVFAHRRLSGLEVMAAMREKFAIQLELADQHWTVALAGLGCDRKMQQRLLLALSDPYWQAAPPADCLSAPSDHSLSAGRPWPALPPVILTPRQAARRKSMHIPWPETVGRIAAGVVCPYPPGIPLLVPGEEITEEIVEYIGWAKAGGIHMRGADDNGMDVLL